MALDTHNALGYIHIGQELQWLMMWTVNISTWLLQTGQAWYCLPLTASSEVKCWVSDCESDFCLFLFEINLERERGKKKKRKKRAAFICDFMTHVLHWYEESVESSAIWHWWTVCKIVTYILQCLFFCVQHLFLQCDCAFLACWIKGLCLFLNDLK